MNNYAPFNQNQSYQSYQPAQYFPQPQGSIYMINNAMDIANVPAGVGVSAAICLRENTLYLKTIQNGAPMLLAYRITPLEGSEPQSQSQEQPSLDKKIAAVLEDYGKRLENLEKQITPKGGGVEWPKI